MSKVNLDGSPRIAVVGCDLGYLAPPAVVTPATDSRYEALPPSVPLPTEKKTAHASASIFVVSIRDIVLILVGQVGSLLIYDHFQPLLKPVRTFARVEEVAFFR